MKKFLTFCITAALFITLSFSIAAACDHNFIIDYANCTAATCTEEGITAYKCSRCNEMKTEKAAKLAHDYIKVSGEEASCINDSTVIEKCSICGNESADKTKAFGHSYTETKRIDATCSKEGSITYKCDVCKETKVETIEKTEHDFSKFISSSASCNTSGQSTYQCTMCSELTLKNVSKLGHDYETKGGPTCTEKGKYTYTCKRCGYSYESSNKAALGHDVPKDRSEWSVVKKATCETEGSIRARCERCKKYVTENIEKKEHNYGTDKYITKFPTATVAGKYVKICSKCGNEVEKAIARGTTDLDSYELAPVMASEDSGYVTRGTTVTLSCELEDVTIYYTTNGKSPIVSSNTLVYDDPIVITDTTTIKAIAKYTGDDSVSTVLSDVVSFGFLVDDNSSWVYLNDNAPYGGYMKLENKKFRPDAKATRYEVILAMDALFDSWAEDEDITFTDVDKEHKNAVSKFVGAKLLNGYEDLTFRGNAPIKRSELSKVLALALGLEIDLKSSVSFPDVSINHWAYPYITALAEEGYITGDTEGNFRPEDNITRAELCVVLNRIADIELTDGVEISDVKKEHWAYNYICSAVRESK